MIESTNKIDGTPNVNKASVRARLSRKGFGSGDILFDGSLIGRFVSYGSGSIRGNTGNKTVYASRIYRGSVKIQVEASTVPALLNKVAAELTEAIMSGAWNNE